MGLKTFTIDFQNISKEKTLRYDVDFANFQNDLLVEKYYSFNDLFEFQENKKVNIENLDDDFFYSEIGNVSKEGEVEPVKLNFTKRKEEEENYYKKIEKGDIIQVEENDILLSKVRPNLKKYILVDEEYAKYFYTSSFINLKPKKLNKILYYSLRTIFYDNLIAISRQGKGYPTLKKEDFLYLKFDKNIIDKFTKEKDQIVAQIELIEKKIKDLKSQITPPQEVINKVFAREFGFDLEKFEESKKEKFFEVDFSIIAKMGALKSNVSATLNSKINFQIPNVKYFKIKSIAKNIFAGGDMPKDFSEEKDEIYKYPIYSNGKENLGFIAYCKKARVKEKATTISARGTIGFAVPRNESYFPIVRLISIIPNEEFILNEYLASVINFQNIEKSGNTIAQLTTPMVENIKIPVPDKKSQQKIVDEIKVELDKQEEIKSKIGSERNKIDEIIEKILI